MGPHILIADANRLLSDRLKQSLEAHEYSVCVVSGGAECLTALHETHPDVLLLDTELKWGGADGVLAVVDEEDDLTTIPVVLLADTDASSLFSKRSNPTEEWVTMKCGDEVVVASSPDPSDKLCQSAHVVDCLPSHFQFERLLDSICRACAPPTPPRSCGPSGIG